MKSSQLEAKLLARLTTAKFVSAQQATEDVEPLLKAGGRADCCCIASHHVCLFNLSVPGDPVCSREASWLDKAGGVCQMRTPGAEDEAFPPVGCY